MVNSSRLWLPQISHSSLSEILWHRSQKQMSFLRVTNAFDKLSAYKLSSFSINKAIRKAVLFPIPGNRDNSFTAFSNNFDDYSLKPM
jgi:hypothetical protein